MWSADVIHSFWVPRLGGKRDLNPWVREPDKDTPKINRLTFTPIETGIFRGQCAEFCGPSHGLMGVRVIVETEAEFENWIAGMKGSAETEPGSAAERGRDVFMQSSCIACHTIEGTNARGVLGPSLTRMGARTTLGAGLLDNTQENIAAWIRDPAAFKPGVLMPGTAEAGGGLPPTGLSEEQVEAVAAYLFSLR
jgi:cytochrome c oxidase subunit 2